MIDILNDTNTLKILEDDQTTALEAKLIKKLIQLKTRNFITEKEYQLYRPNDSQHRRLYGLPKVHKLSVPLRPIISAISTFNYKFTKFQVSKLECLRKSGTIIPNTLSLVEELCVLKIDTSQVKMVSFNITSLFTKVPLDRTIQIILDKAYGKEHTCTYNNERIVDWCSKCKNRAEMKELLESSTKKSNFIFSNKIYSQVNGVAMGSPLGPLLAGIYINYLEEKLMPQLRRNGVICWKRSVDDAFVLIDEDADINNLINILNQFI